MAKRKYTQFVTDGDGNKFVHADAIMSPMVPLIDGLTLVHFKGDKKTYLRLDDAIGWVTEEMKHHSREKYEKVLTVLSRFKNNDNVVENA